MRIDHVELFEVRLPLVRPFETAGGPTDWRELGVLRLTDEDGRCGLGEITPYPDPAAPPLADLVGAFEQHVRPALQDGVVDPVGMQIAGSLPPAVTAAVDTALLDLQARREEVRVVDLIGGPTEQRVAVNATITAEDPVEVAERAHAAVEAGFTTIKLKVGVGDDERRLGAVRDGAGPDTLLRVDPNGSWPTDQAVATIADWVEFGLELIEQPVAPGDLEAMRTVRESTMTPVIADEGVRTIDELEAHINASACDGIAVKLAETGGITLAGELIARATEAGLITFVTSTLDGPIGLAAGIHFAAAHADFSVANGLATGGLFAATYAEGLPQVRAGAIELPEPPGLGIELDEDALNDLALS